MSINDKSNRSFPICKDHEHADWNQPALDGDACVLCRLFYLEAQESLLEEWQQRAKRAEDAIAEIKRPLDEQMARLNATVTRLNGEFERECRDGDRLCQALGVPRTEGGSLNVPKLLAKIKALSAVPSATREQTLGQRLRDAGFADSPDYPGKDKGV